MKFLIISKPKHMIPPEFTVPLVDAFSAFLDQYSASGKLESVWSFAGTQGGGGIINVDSLEELDAIMIEYPFGPSSEVEVYPLADLKESLQRTKQVSQMMAQQMGQ